jgi:hypothetical protein
LAGGRTIELSRIGAFRAGAFRVVGVLQDQAYAREVGEIACVAGLLARMRRASEQSRRAEQ